MAEGFELYEDLLFLGIFLSGLWLSSWFCETIKISSIVGQILFGILLGPNGIDFVPLFAGKEFLEEMEDLEQFENISTFLPEDDTAIENFLVILGQLGVTFLIFESGLHVDFETLQKVGLSALMVAVIGTLMSFVVGISLGEAFGFGAFPEGLAMGAVVAPTSVGIALKLLVDANVLDSTFGQTIVTAAFTDDIFSLITLAVLLELAAGEFSAASVLRPLLSAGLFILVGFLSALYLFPYVIPQGLNWITKKFGQQNRDRVQLCFLFALLAGFGCVGAIIGSHLLGAFLAGVASSKISRTDTVWNSHMGAVNEWLLALFFGATVAFAVPVDELLSFEAFWKGLILAVGIIIAKILSGIVLSKRWVVGWAMVGRGEFSFLVGETLENIEFQDEGKPFLSLEAFGICVWALLIAVFVAPVAFGVVLASQLEREQEEKDNEGSYPDRALIENRPLSNISAMSVTQRARAATTVLFKDKKEWPRSRWVVTVESESQNGLASEIMAIFASSDIQVLSFLSEDDGAESLITFVLLVPDPAAGHVSTNDHLIFKDEYFAFDIEKYMRRLTDKLIAIINGDADVKAHRQNDDKERRPVPTNSVHIVKKASLHSVERKKWSVYDSIEINNSETDKPEQSHSL